MWRSRVRLTRRGRVVVVALLVAVAGAGGAFAATASEAAAGPAGEAPVVVVQPGDSLWSIAARTAPDTDPIATIDEIRRLNGLTDYTVYAGQRLTLPRRR